MGHRHPLANSPVVSWPNPVRRQRRARQGTRQTMAKAVNGLRSLTFVTALRIFAEPEPGEAEPPSPPRTRHLVPSPGGSLCGVTREQGPPVPGACK